MCLYLGGSSQHVASLYTGMLLLELIPGATRPSTDINNNNNNAYLIKRAAHLVKSNMQFAKCTLHMHSVLIIDRDITLWVRDRVLCFV